MVSLSSFCKYPDLNKSQSSKLGSQGLNNAKPRTSLQMFFVLSIRNLHRSILRFFFRVPENTNHLDYKTHDNNDRTRIRTWIYVPRPFLHHPYNVYQCRMKSRFPEEKRRCPRQVCKELIVQASSAKQPYYQRCQHRCTDKRTCHRNFWLFPYQGVSNEIHKTSS